MDIATLSGIFAGFGVALGAVFLGPGTGKLAYLVSLMFVLGGTCAAILLSCPASDVWRAFRIGIRSLIAKNIPDRDAVTVMVDLAETSQKEGIAALENIRTANPVLKKAARLIAGNTDPDLIRDALAIEILALRRRHNICISVFIRLALYAPAIGMLGTLAWLVRMPAVFNSPDALGQGMITALMTTLYGCLLSLLVFLPAAGRLKTHSAQGEYRLNIIFEGARSILENNNPKSVYAKLASFLSLEERASAR